MFIEGILYGKQSTVRISEGFFLLLFAFVFIFSHQYGVYGMYIHILDEYNEHKPIRCIFEIHAKGNEFVFAVGNRVGLVIELISINSSNELDIANRLMVIGIDRRVIK